MSSRALSQLGAKKIAFTPKPDIRTDISNHRVASLLKSLKIELQKSLFIILEVLTFPDFV